MTPQELKNSIVQHAIQGKLVEQRPEEGTGEELYQQIQEEKKKLIQEGKIKKEKPLPEITEGEKPFDIPETWKWVQLGTIIMLNPKNELDDNLDVGFIPMPCVADGYRNEHTYEIKKWKEIKKGFSHFAEQDIGVAKITPCFQNRKSVIFHNLPNKHGAGTTELSIIRIINETVSRKYLLWFFKSDFFISNGIKSFTGTAGQQRIHKDYLSTVSIPLPPLSEQKRIVAKIEELLPLIDRYEKAWNRLEEFNKRFPDDLQKSLLQLAIQGKLVEQRLEEGTGEELYQQIKHEKQELIRAGKLKNEKPLPEIMEDEKPFDIPESWSWKRLKQIALTIVDCPHSTPKYYNETTDFAAIDTNCIDSEGYITHLRYVDKKTYYERIQRLEPKENDIVYTREGSICRAALLPNKMICLGQRVMLIRCPQEMPAKYIQMILMTPHTVAALTSQQKGIGAKHINVADVCNLPVPIPPPLEQKKIIMVLNELLQYCKKLKGYNVK